MDNDWWDEHRSLIWEIDDLTQGMRTVKTNMWIDRLGKYENWRMDKHYWKANEELICLADEFLNE